MKKRREELRQDLEEETEKLIEEILDWYEANERPTMSQIEREVLTIRERLGQATTHKLIQAQEAVHPEKVPVCPKCQEPMRYKGEKRKSIDGLIGSVGVERAYYYCSECEAGLFPPG